MSEIVKKLRQSYQLTITETQEYDLCWSSLIRNCIIHNSSRANRLLAEYDGYEEGNEFEISAGDVHSRGIRARELARSMYAEAVEKHGIDVE